MEYEYARYSGSPSGYVRRAKDSTDDWAEVSIEGLREAESAYIAEKLAGAQAAEQGRLNATIIRSEGNKEIARELGLTADELAELLARPDRNSGTRRRIPDSAFDELAQKLGLSPQEARDRFAGRYWEA